MLISTGVPGLLLAISAFVLQPMWRLLGQSRLSRDLHLAALSSLIFVAINNMLETSLMDRSNIAWVVLLVVTATAMHSERANMDG
ncbi:MAG: hypothetical protein EON88_04330 [Brevundimonas sp.]|nr:MAG: hypothetical protein EON88_04330 [Brevundimonas sp.]